MSEISGLTVDIESTMWQIFGSPLYIGLFIFFFFVILVASYRLGPACGFVILIPASFIIVEFVPSALFGVAIIIGLTIALAIGKLIR